MSVYIVWINDQKMRSYDKKIYCMKLSYVRSLEVILSYT